LFSYSGNYQSQLNELIEEALVSNFNYNTNNLNSTISKNNNECKFLEILNNNFNHIHKKGFYSQNIQIDLTEDNIKFNANDDTYKNNNNKYENLKETYTKKNKLKYNFIFELN